MNKNITIPGEKIADFCKRNKIVRLSVFGSALRDDFTPESDVDILVDFEHGKEPGLIGLAGMENELSGILNRKVDLRTPEDISHLFRKEVIQTAELQYAG